MNWFKNIFVLLLGFVAAVFFLSIQKFDFSYEIKVADILGILVTLLIALLIQLYLVKKSDANKIEKDIIIEQAKTVRNRFENVRDAFFDLYISQTVSVERNKRMLSMLKSLANSIETFEHSFRLANSALARRPYKQIRMIYYAYKKELTIVDVRKPFSEKTFQVAEAIFDDANRELVSIILFVNQS